MKVQKVLTGELNGKPSIWMLGDNEEIVKLAQFVDEECYHDFLRAVEAGYFKPSSMKKVPDELKAERLGEAR